MADEKFNEVLEDLEELLQTDDTLSQWESEFITSILQQNEDGKTLTPRQRAKAVDICNVHDK